MGKPKIAEYPQDRYSFRLYDNVEKLDWPKIMARHPGCVAAINTAYFALSGLPSKGIKAFDHQSAVMFAGKWGYAPAYHEYGICIDAQGYMTLGTEKEAVYDYAVALPPAVINGKPYNTTKYARNGATYSGFKSDGTVVLLLCGKDDGMTSGEAVAALQARGCVHVLRWDGSWSSRGTLGPGMDVRPSQYRCDRTWLLVFQRKQTGGQEPPEKEEIHVGDLSIIKKFTTKNPCYTANIKRKKTEAMLHSTGTPGADAAAIMAAWDTPSAGAGVEFVIDPTGVYQCLPLGIKSGHAAGSANNTHVACEICEPEETIFLPINWRPLKRGGQFNKVYAVKRLQQELSALGFDPKGVDGSFGPGCEAAVQAYQRSVGIAVDGSVGPTTLKYLQKREGSYLRYDPALAADYFADVYGKAVALFAWLMKEISGDPKEIVCHSEGFKLGIASNHADVLHWFPQHGKTMDTFRADVTAAMSGETSPADPLGEAVDKLAAKGILTAPDYWKGGNYSAANVQALIIKMAAAI